MSRSDVSLAFGNLEARAKAGAGDVPLDRISLRDHVVEVEIGAFQQERGRLQRVSFNVVVEVQPVADAIDDDVDRILSYDTITEAIQSALSAERLNLLETLAARIAEILLAEPQAQRVFVRVEKLDRGPGALGVEIVRSREGLGEHPRFEREHPHPKVLFLSNDEIGSASLPELITAEAAGDAPLLICVGASDVAAPQSAEPLAQNRIDLLAIEQNAWVLAGRDPRCVVVETRTELDWAMKHGQICVWAPSKLVLDAVERPSARPSDALSLAAWFAEAMEAQEMVISGQGEPRCSIPVRHVRAGGAG